MRRTMFIPQLYVVCAVLPGCGPTAPVCTTVPVPAIQLAVVDSVTMAAPAVPTMLIVRDGLYVDTLPHPGATTFDGHTFEAAPGRPELAPI